MDIARHAAPVTRDLLGTFRAVVVSGPRQAGKTTLLGQLDTGGDRRTFDDVQELDAARRDPTTYVSQLPAGSSVDEFQRAGDPFLLAAKQRLDRDRTRGQLLLAGSTSFLTSKRIADSLAGRVGLVELWPFSVGEVEGRVEQFIDDAFRRPDELIERRSPFLDRASIADRIARGGFPEPSVMSGRARRAWFRSYLATIATKDVVDEVGEVRKLAEFRRILDLTIARSAHEANAAAIAADAGVHPTTVANYVELLRSLMVVHELPAWATSATTTAKRHPKRYAVDTGLATAVLGTDTDALTDVRSPLFGQLLETFVVNELAKQRTWAETEVRLHHYRDRSGREIDVLLVGPADTVVAIEINGSATVTTADARHLATFRERIGSRFVHGIVLYLGARAVPLGPGITALPVSALWA